MSYSHTFIIPKDPEFVPADEQISRGKEFLEKKLNGDYPPPRIENNLEPRLYSTEENWRSFTCPHCKKVVNYDYQDGYISNWWYCDLYALNSPDQVLTVPCCGSKAAGREFNFGADAAFSRFAIKIEDFNIMEDGYFTKEAIENIDINFGFKTRIIIAQGT